MSIDINVGDLAKPATVLVKRISDAIGGIFKPYQIRRVAEAEAEAKVVLAIADLRIEDIQKRALVRFVHEETGKQGNIESIAEKSLKHLSVDAQPEKVENDWLVHFLDRCRLISDEEMQEVWAKILADESNHPGAYSKRTLNLLATLDKRDAVLFRKLCGFVWDFPSSIPLFYFNEELGFDVNFYREHGFTWETLKHIEDIGLIRFEVLTGFHETDMDKVCEVKHFGSAYAITFHGVKNNLDVGNVLLTKIGIEISKVCAPEKIEGFEAKVVEFWRGIRPRILSIEKLNSK